MALTTYSELKTEILNHLDRDDLDTDVDTLLDLCEARLARDIRVREMIKRCTTTVSEQYIGLPTGYLEMKTMRLLTDPETYLGYLNPDEMNRRRQTTSGKPLYYTVHEEIEFDRVPDTTYTLEMIHFAKFTALSDANTTTTLLDRAPDLYLYGSLLAAEPFLDNDERIGTWKGLYDDAKMQINRMDIRARHPGPQIARPYGAIY